MLYVPIIMYHDCLSTGSNNYHVIITIHTIIHVEVAIFIIIQLLKSHNLIGWNTLVQVEQVPYASFAPKLNISDNSPCILADVYINVGEGIVDADTLDGILNSMFYSIEGVVKEWK